MNCKLVQGWFCSDSAFVNVFANDGKYYSLARSGEDWGGTEIKDIVVDGILNYGLFALYTDGSWTRER